MAEALTIDVVESQYMEYQCYLDPTDVLTICANLVSGVLVDKDDQIYSVSEEGTTILRLAHSSVKETLLTQYHRVNKPQKFDIHPVRAHHMMANSCLTYLLRFESLGSNTRKTTSSARSL